MKIILNTFKILTLISAGLVFSSAAEEKIYRDKSGRQGRFTIDQGVAKPNNGALIFFHGSGATNSYAANFSGLTKIAQKFGLTPVSLQAPDDSISWAEKGPESGRISYAHELLQNEIFGKSLKLNARKVVFVGVSAGATFVAGDLLPAHVEKYQGGAVLLCGGASPIYPTRLPETIKDFRMFFAINHSDFLFTQTLMGINFWQARHIPVKHFEPPEGGHCGFDLERAMSDGIKFILDSK
jgi:hypothetical protein